MKKSFYSLILIGFSLMFVFNVSCNKTPTYEELKAAERKIIRRIIAEKNMEILDEFPENGVFGENQYVELNSGIYINVIDSGNGNRAIYGGSNSTEVLVRASGEFYESDSTHTFNTFLNFYAPFEFKYGSAYNVVEEHKYSSDMYYLVFGVGIESILAYVGDSAVVKMLVPGYSEIRSGSNSISAGSTLQSSRGSYFIPIFYDRVRYTFYK